MLAENIGWQTNYGDCFIHPRHSKALRARKSYGAWKTLKKRTRPLTQHKHNENSTKNAEKDNTCPASKTDAPEIRTPVILVKGLYCSITSNKTSVLSIYLRKEPEHSLHKQSGVLYTPVAVIEFKDVAPRTCTAKGGASSYGRSYSLEMDYIKIRNQ